MEPPLTKLEKVRITCRKIKYFVIRHFNKKQFLQKLKSKKFNDSVVLAFLEYSGYIQSLVSRQKESLFQICVNPSGVAKWGRGGGPPLAALLWGLHCKGCIETKVVLMSGHYSQLKDVFDFE